MRYATPSPATPPACERSKPFFLKTKLVPMSTPLVTALNASKFMREGSRNGHRRVEFLQNDTNNLKVNDLINQIATKGRELYIIATVP